jgi:four helix bundle protein
MFDFEMLEVYGKTKKLNKSISSFLGNKKIDRVTHDQLRRASFSIMLNIAEGSGRFTRPDKRNFYIIARGSVFECVAIMDYLKDLSVLSNEDFESYYLSFEEISKMLFSLIKGLEG